MEKETTEETKILHVCSARLQNLCSCGVPLEKYLHARNSELRVETLLLLFSNDYRAHNPRCELINSYSYLIG